MSLRTMETLRLLSPVFHSAAFGENEKLQQKIWLFEEKAQGIVIISNSISPKERQRDIIVKLSINRSNGYMLIEISAN